MTTDINTNGSQPVAGDTVGSKAPPTLRSILDLVENNTKYYQAFHDACREEESYYFGERKVAVPKGMDNEEVVDQVRPATARAIVNIATDHVDVDNISIDVPLMPRSRARAEKIKKFYQGAWLSIKGPVLRTAAKHAFMYGIAWLRPMFEPQRWPDAPNLDDYGEMDANGEFQLTRGPEYKEALEMFLHKRKLTFPLTCENINPKEMLWDDDSAGAKWVIRKVETTITSVAARFPKWEPMAPLGDMGTWIEYWDDTYYAYIVGNDWVKEPTLHGYGFLPFFPVLPSNVIDWDAGLPQRRYQGILRPVHSLLDAEAAYVTQIAALMRTNAYRTLDFQGPMQQAQQAADDYEMFGGKNVYPDSVKVAVSPHIALPPDLTNQLSMVQTMIEEATFPNVIRGMRPKGVSTGFGISVLAGMGRLVFQGVASGLARAIEQCNSGFAMLVENVVRNAVTVHARSEVHQFDQTIGPDDIKGYYENIVTLKAEAPEEAERESLLAMRLHQAGIISLYEAQRRSRVTNPLEEQVQQAAEKMLEMLRPQQAEELMKAIQGTGLPEQLAEAADGGGGGNAGQFLAGQSQLQRPGEAAIQRQRVQSRARPGVFPKGLSGLDALAGRLGGATGGAQGMPSGQTVA